MNKSQLIDKISSNSCISKVAANRVLDAMTSSVIESLKNGDHVFLVGFGTFIVKFRGSRFIKNLHTGEKILIKASKVPSFRAGKRLRSSVNL